MAKYQPNIPTGSVNLDQDYKNLRSNFQALNTVFGKDHTTFDNVTGQLGYHQWVRIIPFSTITTNPPDNSPPTAPPTTTGIPRIWTAQTDDGWDIDSALYYKTGGNTVTSPPTVGKVIQLTCNFVPTLSSSNLTPGTSFMAGGLVVKWGSVTGTHGGANHFFNGGDTGTVTLGFANTVYNIQTTLAYNDNIGTPNNSASGTVSIDTQATSTASFKWLMTTNSGSFRQFFWIAFGS